MTNKCFREKILDNDKKICLFYITKKLHLLQYFYSIIPCKSTLLNYAVENSNLECLKYVHTRSGNVWDLFTCRIAVISGSLECLTLS